MRGKDIHYYKHFQLEYGQYVEIHEKTDNTMKRRTESALYLHPSGNNQGGGFSMKIDKGERVHRNICTVIPMPEKKVNYIHQLVKQQKYQKERLEFRDRM